MAHNMPFDLKVMRASLAYYGLYLPPVKTLDTVVTSRHFLTGRVANFKLNTLASYYQIPLNHHQALDDARACGLILSHQLQEFGDDRVSDFIRHQ